MHQAARRAPTTGLRWDRLGRLAMVVAVLVLLALYIRSGLSLWSAWHASAADGAKVVTLQAQNAQLKQQRSELHQRWEAEAAARRLGMAHEGEKAYVIRGLPAN